MRLVTGFQRGVDRGAADAAIACGLDVSGFVPKGRLAEDGKIPSHYGCIELPTTDYQARTKANVEMSHGTLILLRGTRNVDPKSGTGLTVRECVRLGRPYLVRDIDGSENLVFNWIEALIDAFDSYPRMILNVAGPRESKSPGIEVQAYDFMVKVLQRIVE